MTNGNALFLRQRKPISLVGFLYTFNIATKDRIFRTVTSGIDSFSRFLLSRLPLVCFYEISNQGVSPWIPEG
jgi:hypothetical protein